MKPIPFPSGNKKGLPKDNMPDVAIPEQAQTDKTIPDSPEFKKQVPINSELSKGSPDEPNTDRQIPDDKEFDKEFPSDLIAENCVKIGEKIIELKPTKLKYFRNKMASAYGVIKAIPLNEFLAYGKGTIDPNIDADQVLYNFLVAAFDDSAFVRDNYDDMTADDVEQVIRIFGRLNHIDEKEEIARKNRQAQEAKR